MRFGMLRLSKLVTRNWQRGGRAYTPGMDFMLTYCKIYSIRNYYAIF